MRPAIALTLEVDILAVFKPPERLFTGPSEPCIVVFGENHARLGSADIERENPAIFIVRGSRDQNRLAAALIENRWRVGHLATGQTAVEPLPFPALRVEN